MSEEEKTEGTGLITNNNIARIEATEKRELKHKELFPKIRLWGMVLIAIVVIVIALYQTKNWIEQQTTTGPEIFITVGVICLIVAAAYEIRKEMKGAK